MSSASSSTVIFASLSSAATKALSCSPLARPESIVLAKSVLNAFTTFASGNFFCSSSAPLVVKPTASFMSGVTALVTSTTVLPSAL